MDFELPEELRMLKETVRRFVDREIIPIEREAYDGHKMKPDVRAHLEAKAQEIGLWNYDVPEEYGGQGMGMLARCVIWEEMGRTIAIPTRGGGVFGPAVSPILYYLNEEQKKKYLYPVIEGKRWGCFMQTEPDAGGDPGGMRTTAVRQGDHYVINGYKRFITGADRADFAQVLAATDRAKGSRGGISAFLVDMDTPGVKLVRPQETMMDDRPWEIALEDVKVPVENRIYEENKGWDCAKFLLGNERSGIARVGASKAQIRRLREIAAMERIGDRPLIEDERFAMKIAAIEVELKALEMTQLRVVAAERTRRGNKPDPASSILKIKGSEIQQNISELLMEAIGPYALPDQLPHAEDERWNEPPVGPDYAAPLAPMYFNWRKISIYGGSNEIQKNIIAKAILGL